MKTLLLLIIVLCNIHLLASDNTEDLITTEFVKLKNLANVPDASLTLTNLTNRSSKAYRNGKIEINVIQLNKLLTQVDQSNKINIIRLVVAHEIGHQMQFKSNTTSSNQLINECQADVLAGFLSFYLSLNEGLITKNFGPEKIKELEKTSSDSMNAIFLLGDEYNLSHPTSEQRRRAFRSGMLLSIIQITDDVIRSSIPESQKKESRVLAKKYLSLLNYIGGDNILLWTKRETNKILHFSNEQCKNIVVFYKWKWNESSENPTIEYTETIKNLGSKRIRFSYTDQVVYASRKYAGNSLYWDLVSADHQTIMLNPGEAKTLNQRLKWEATEERMPKFIPPGARGSLYTCVQIDAISKNTSTPEDFSLSTIQEDMTDINALDVIFNSQDDLSKFISGIGTCLGPDCDYISYESKVQVGDAETQLIYNQSERSLHMEIVLYNGSEKLEAEKKIAMISKELKMALPGSSFTQEETIMDSIYMSLLDSDKKELGDIYITKLPTGMYKVGVNVYSKTGVIFN